MSAVSPKGPSRSTEELRINMKLTKALDVLLPLLVSCAVLAGCRGEYHEPLWSQRFDSYAESCGTDVAIDSEGNIVVVGSYRRSLSVGGEELPRVSGDGLFLAKYNSDGEHLWSKQLATGDNSMRLEVGANGDIVIALDFFDEVSVLGRGFRSAAGSGVVVIKADADGSFLWGRTFESEGTSRVNDMSIDGENGIVLSGLFREAIVFGEDRLESSEGSNGFVARLGPFGSADWAKSFGNGSGGINALAVNRSGDVAISGAEVGSASDPSSEDAIKEVAKYSSTGVFEDSWQVGATLLAWTADERDLVLSAAVEAPQTIGNGSREVSGEFLARVAPDGELVWKAEVEDRQWRDMAIDAEDRVHLVSDSRRGSGDGRFAWVTTYDSDGYKHGRSEVFDSLGGARVTAVAAGPEGHVVATGCARDDEFFLAGDESFFLSAVLAP